MVKKNYKSDFELIYTLLDSEGNEMQVPDNPWELWLSCGNPLGANGRKFIASYDGSAYRNCEVRDNNIIVYADNHHLPTGVLWTTFVDYQPNLSFADGDKTIYTPQPTNVELVSGAGDEPTETDIEILANYVVFEHEYTAGAGIDISNGEIGLDTATQTAIASIAGKASEDELQNVLDVLTSNIADVAQDVQSVETELQEKADNTDIDRVIAIINNDEHGLPSKADVADVTALGNRVTAVEGDVSGLTTGNDPALRQSDATISGEFGKVVKVVKFEVEGETPLGVIGADVVEATFVGNKDNGSFFAFPDSTQEVKTKADDTLLGQGDKTTLERQINGKASTSSVNAIDGRVTTLENTYEDTMNIANNQLHELIDGKAQIAQALTDRGYPTAPTDSSASMAQKIENMSYDAGWLAQLGYSETNDGGVKDDVAYALSVKESYESGTISKLNNLVLPIVPVINTSGKTDFSDFFNNSIIRYLPKIDVSSGTSFNRFCYNLGTSILKKIPKLDTSKGYSFNDWLRGNRRLEKIEEIDLSSAYTFGDNYCFMDCDNLVYFLAKNTGKRETIGTLRWESIKNWGAYNETNRQSLVDTLLTYSYDRVTAGYSACTIKLHTNTLARLTQEEIAAITAKGFTLTS